MGPGKSQADTLLSQQTLKSEEEHNDEPKEPVANYKSTNMSGED